MGTETESLNPDLAWELDAFINRERAMDFVSQFETTLCVYSPSVEQLYSTYNMYLPEDEGRKLVILPDPGAFHDTFNFVHKTAVLRTGLYIIPGELVGKPGLQLSNVGEDRSLGARQVAFEAGFRSIAKRRPPDDPFLPVLVKGDLREFNQAWPVVHLHRVTIAGLELLSDLDKSSIRSVIEEKLESLFIEERKKRDRSKAVGLGDA